MKGKRGKGRGEKEKVKGMRRMWRGEGKLEDERMDDGKIRKGKNIKWKNTIRKNHKGKNTKRKSHKGKKQSFVAFNICACFYKKLNLVRGSCLYRNMVAVAFYYSAARVKRL